MGHTCASRCAHSCSREAAAEYVDIFRTASCTAQDDDTPLSSKILEDRNTSSKAEIFLKIVSSNSYI